MTDTYYDSAEGQRIDLPRFAAFHNEVKPDSRGLYSAQAVLQWLGY